MKNPASRSPHARRRFLAGLAGLSALPLLPARGSAQAAPELVEARLNADASVSGGFVADNPGDWMFHCHVLEHQASGMMSCIRVS